MSAIAVTGASGFLGQSVARLLLAEGRTVVNLTAHPSRADPFAGAVRAEALDFGNPARLTYALRDADTLVNTYWVRFEHGTTTFDGAVRNIEGLMRAAASAGVQRVVHVSITNPAIDSPLPYFAGKARAEETVRGSGMSWAIVRPTMLFGPGDILLNNIAWTLRHLPAFGVPGDGSYPVQPVFVDDVASLIAGLVGTDEQATLDAGGPDRYTFDELVRVVRWAIGSHARIVHMPPRLALAGARLVSAAMRDVMLTDEEVRGLMAGLLVAEGAPVGRTSLAQWLLHHRDAMGRRYASELARHYRAA